MTKMLDEGEAYDWRVGRWSGMVGEAFVAWLGRPAGLRWLELGCGAGALSRAALEVGGAASLVGVDPSAGAIARAGAIVDDARADFRQGAAEALAFPDDGFDVVVSGLALNFMADSSAAMLEMSRVVVPGGTIAGYVWDFAGEMQVFRRFWDAAIAVDPKAAASDQGPRFPLCRPEPLRRLFTDAGLGDVEVRALDVVAEFPDLETYWRAMITGEGSTGGYAATLSEADLEAIHQRLRQSLEIRADGSFRLTARAWAARGTG